MLVGNGFDIHKHSNDEKLVLGGISVEGPGFEAHSDGDIILHSLSDALLGSKAKKDLGFYFPSNENTPKNISSVEMLNKVLEIIEYDKVVINNIDITVLSQVINISKISEAIISNLADLLRIDKQLINVKGKSFDNLGVIGDGIASACIALVSVKDA
jgi:2-C-methyl-D-erythritol 4-phosphate cytidylyltransferase/2-C-methyl-D-erythritol 2,4-cyclodiphosphate synthase